MTLRAHYRRAAIAKRALDAINARLDRIGRLMWRGVPIKVWNDAAVRGRRVAEEREQVFAVLRAEAALRMLYDPREEMETREILRRASEAHRRVMS